MRDYLESVRNGAPGNMQEFMDSAWGTLSPEEGDALIKIIAEMRENSLHVD